MSKVFMHNTSTVVSNNAPTTAHTYDMNDTQGVTATVNSTLVVSPYDANERLVSKASQATNVFGFWSERVAAEVTIAGTITVHVYAGVSASTSGARLRVRVFKITAGGSYVETLIGMAEGSSDLPVVASFSAAQLQTLTITPTPSVTLGVNERLICRVYVFRADGAAPGVGTVWFTFNAATGVVGDSYLDFTESLTFIENDERLYFRRTNVAGVSTHLDLLPTRGSSAFTTGVVNTATQSTGVFTTPWTRTAGGTVLTFVSPRLAANWSPSSANYMGGAKKISGKESSASANAGLKVRIYRLTPAGAETEIFQSNVATEFTTTDAIYTYSYNFVAATTFDEDDRILIRIYLLAVGAMTTGFTATFDYDHDVLDAAGDSYVTFRELPAFKAESDPAKASVPDGLPMTGIGN